VLQNSFDVVMVDARNHGQTSRAPASLDAMADDLLAVIKSLGFEHPALLGHSMGASMVANLAARYPELPARILLEDPPWAKSSDAPLKVGEGEKRRKMFLAYIESMRSKSDEDIIAQCQALNPQWHDDDMPGWAASKRQVSPDAMQGLSMGEWRETVAAIQCPALLIYADGEDDGIVKHAVAEEVAETNKNFNVQHIPNAGHNIRRENFTDYMKAVEGFLAPYQA
jgi:N-formylmaleamate deformylase